MNHKSNSRAKKTETHLQNILIDLLKLKNIDEISVTEITKTADVHRGTFYNHYIDIYDLFEKVEYDFLKKTKQIFITYFVKPEPDIKTLYKEIYKLYTENKFLTETMFSKGRFDFFDKFIKWRTPNNFEEWQSNYSVGDKKNYSFYYISLISALFALLHTWFEEGFKTSSDEIASIAKSILERFGFKKQFKN